MNLYEINSQYLDLLTKIENGDIAEDAIKDTLESVESDLTEKIDNIACFIKSLTADVVALKEEASKLEARRKQKEAKAEQLRLYLESAMQSSGLNKVETARNMLQLKLSPPSVKIAEGFISWATIHNKELLRFNAPAPDKEAIKALLKDGKDVGYCSLEQNEKLHLK